MFLVSCPKKWIVDWKCIKFINSIVWPHFCCCDLDLWANDISADSCTWYADSLRWINDQRYLCNKLWPGQENTNVWPWICHYDLDPWTWASAWHASSSRFLPSNLKNLSMQEEVMANKTYMENILGNIFNLDCKENTQFGCFYWQ